MRQKEVFMPGKKHRVELELTQEAYDRLKATNKLGGNITDAETIRQALGLYVSYLILKGDGWQILARKGEGANTREQEVNFDR